MRTSAKLTAGSTTFMDILSWNSMIVVHRWPLLNPQLQATKMYGILLQNLAAYVIDKHGERKWNEIKESLKLTQVSKFEVYGCFFLNYPYYSPLF